MKIALMSEGFFLWMFISLSYGWWSKEENTRPHFIKGFEKSLSIHWDTSTLMRLSPAGSAAFYPRMIQLSTGDLLAVYASGGNIVSVRSSNGGRNWSAPQIIAPVEEGVNIHPICGNFK